MVKKSIMKVCTSVLSLCLAAMLGVTINGMKDCEDSSDEENCNNKTISGPKVLVSNRRDIRKINLESGQQQIIQDNLRSAIAIDYNYKKQQIYWSDVQEETISRANLTWSNGNTADASNKPEVIVNKTDNVDGIAYDWIHDVLYWTDMGKNTIELLTIQERNHKTLFDTRLDEPRAIVVDPRDDQKWLYWSDWGRKPKIEKAGLDGSNRRLVVATDLTWPNGLTIDYAKNRLYWADAKKHTIGSSDLNGHDRQVILTGYQYLRQPFAITLFQDFLYWSEWESSSIYKANKNNGTEVQIVAPNLYSPMDLVVYHELRQPKGNDPCETSDSKCSHICLAAPVLTTDGSKFTCTCPDGGLLKADGITCEMPGQPRI